MYIIYSNILMALAQLQKKVGAAVHLFSTMKTVQIARSASFLINGRFCDCLMTAMPHGYRRPPARAATPVGQMMAKA